MWEDKEEMEIWQSSNAPRGGGDTLILFCDVDLDQVSTVNSPPPPPKKKKIYIYISEVAGISSKKIESQQPPKNIPIRYLDLKKKA